MKVFLECTHEAFDKLQAMVVADSFPANFPHGIERLELVNVMPAGFASPAEQDLNELVKQATECAHEGYLKKALLLLESAEAKVESAGIAEMDIVRYRAALAKIYIYSHDVSQSRRILEDALDLAQEVLQSPLSYEALPVPDLLAGIDSTAREVLLQLYNNIGEWYHITGDLERAEEIHDSVLEARKKFLPDSSSDTLISINNLAEVLRKKGEKESALRLHTDAYETRSELLGPSHLDTLVSLWNIILTNDELDNYIDASIQQRKLLDILENKASLCPVESLIRKYAETRAQAMSAKAGNPSTHAYVRLVQDDE